MEAPVKWRSDEFTMSAEVFPYGLEDRTSITVHRWSMGSGFRVAEINWPATGAQDRITTEAFARGLLKAVKVADEMQNPVHIYKVVLDVALAATGERKVFERLIAANSQNQALESIRQGVDSDGNIVRVELIEEVSDAKTEAGS